MGFLDKLTNKLAPISDEKAIQIIRGNLGLIESKTKTYIDVNGKTESVVYNRNAKNNSNNEESTFRKTLNKVHTLYPEFKLDKPHFFVACYIFHMYANPNLDKETKKEFSNYLSNGIFTTFIDKACSNLWNDVGKLLIIPRTYDQEVVKENIEYNFADIMFEYDFLFNNRNLDEREQAIQKANSQRVRKK